MANHSLGQLSSTPVKKNDFTVTTQDPTDVFKFTIGSTSNINLSLTDIRDADPDIKLYRDNGDGVYGSGDTQVGSSTDSDINDDAINVQGTAGTYFAVVNRFSGSSATSVSYDLHASVTPPALTTQPSNLLPKEVVVGDWIGLFQDQTLYGSVGDSNTSDTYHFHLLRTGGTVGFDTVSSITLSGLSSDADIRLIRDSNDNRIVDPGEEISRSEASGTVNDVIQNINQGGSYFLQVYQYSGNTNYTLNFDYTYVPPV
jgi:hypothetical protein